MTSIAYERTNDDPISGTTARAAEPLMTENLRRETRIEARIRVLVVRGRETVPLLTSDVSFKGLFLETNEPPPLRSLMRLRVALPQREIEAHAMAIHVTMPGDGARGSGVGVQFWGLAGPERALWDDFVRERIAARKTALEAANKPK